MTFAVSALVLVGLLEVVGTWRLIRGLRRLDRVDERMSHLTEALRLLTETTEAGFKASAFELSRVADRAAAPAAPPTAPAAVRDAPAVSKAKTRRVATAVRKGRSVKVVAASESMSEAEARLRLHLAGAGAARSAASREGTRGAMRA